MSWYLGQLDPSWKTKAHGEQNHLGSPSAGNSHAHPNGRRIHGRLDPKHHPVDAPERWDCPCRDLSEEAELSFLLMCRVEGGMSLDMSFHMDGLPKDVAKKVQTSDMLLVRWM